MFYPFFPDSKPNLNNYIFLNLLLTSLGQGADNDSTVSIKGNMSHLLNLFHP